MAIVRSGIFAALLISILSPAPLLAFEPEVVTEAVQVYGLGQVEEVAFSPDGTKVLLGAAANAQLWEVDGDVVRTFTGHTGKVVSVAFSPDGSKIATASADHTARIWNIATGATLHVLSGHSDEVRTVAFSPNGELIATASLDNTAKVWNVATGAVVRTIIGHTNDVNSVAFHPDGNRIATCGADLSGRLWNVNTGGLLQVYSTGSCPHLAFSPDGSILATSGGSTFTLWNTDSGQLIRSISTSTTVYFLAFSPSGTTIASNLRIGSGCSNYAVGLWNVATGAAIRNFNGHCGTIFGLAFSPDGSFLLSGSSDWTARLWDVAAASTLRTFRRHTAQLTTVAISPDGTKVATGSQDRTVRIWNRVTGESLLELTEHAAAVHSVVFSPDGSRVLTGSNDGSAILWDAEFGTNIRNYPGHTSGVFDAVFSPDGSQVVTASFDGTTRVRDTETRALIQVFSGFSFTQARYFPDGTRILTGTTGPAVLWDIATGQNMGSFNPPCGTDGIDISGAGRIALSGTGSSSSTCWRWRLWDEQSASFREYVGHENRVSHLSFSAEGCRVASVSWDSTARVWDTTTRNTLAVYRGHIGSTSAVDFAPVGVITGGDDGTARLWRADVVPPCDDEQPALDEDVPDREVTIDHLWQWHTALDRFVKPEDGSVDIDPTKPTYLLTHGWDGTLDGIGVGDACEEPGYAMSSIGCAIREKVPDANLLAWDWADVANPNKQCDLPDEIIEAGGEAAFQQAASLLITGGVSTFSLVMKGVTTIARILLDARLSGIATRDEGYKLGMALAKEIREHGSLGSELHLIGKSHGGGVLGFAALVLRNRGYAPDSLTTLDTPRVIMNGDIVLVDSLTNVEPFANTGEGKTAVLYYPDFVSGGVGEPNSRRIHEFEARPGPRAALQFASSLRLDRPPVDIRAGRRGLRE